MSSLSGTRRAIKRANLSLRNYTRLPISVTLDETKQWVSNWWLECCGFSRDLPCVRAKIRRRGMPQNIMRPGVWSQKRTWFQTPVAKNTASCFMLTLSLLFQHRAHIGGCVTHGCTSSAPDSALLTELSNVILLSKSGVDWTVQQPQCPSAVQSCATVGWKYAGF